MQLVIYSGGYYEDNILLNQSLLELCGKSRPRLTFIPSSSEWGMQDFAEFVDAFDQLKNLDYIYFPVDHMPSPSLVANAFESDIVFLAGGNTFHFLSCLRKHRLISKILKFAQTPGKVLAGLSAGAIMLTPSITTAGFPSFDCDDNYVNLKDHRSLGLVPFELFPHYRNSDRYRRALVKYSKDTKNPLLGLPDLSGLIVNQNETRLVGNVHIFNQGKGFRIDCATLPKVV
jgi:dipeptidase E